MHTALKTVIRTTINSVDRTLGIRAILHQDDPPHPLAGDRAIEWSWIVARLPGTSRSVLDLGCVQSPLTGIAARLGHQVTAVDLRDIEYRMDGVTFLYTDIREMPEASFDVIMNCSMIEHVGLPDRYGESARPDGDCETMDRLSRFLAPGGRMLLTIPVGLDAIYAPFHRVYGVARLPDLLRSYRVLEEEFWEKSGVWTKCAQAHALSLEGSPSSYALGLFVLESLPS